MLGLLFLWLLCGFLALFIRARSVTGWQDATRVVLAGPLNVWPAIQRARSPAKPSRPPAPVRTMRPVAPSARPSAATAVLRVPDLNCPSCQSAQTQRVSLAVAQQATTGGTSALALEIGPPTYPYPFWKSFVVGFMTWIFGAWIALDIHEPALGVYSFAAWLLIWFGLGGFARWRYDRQMRDWEQYAQRHFLCLRCGVVFQPLAQTGAAAS